MITDAAKRLRPSDNAVTRHVLRHTFLHVPKPIGFEAYCSDKREDVVNRLSISQMETNQDGHRGVYPQYYINEH